jgi:hypothetical protein
LVLTLYMSWHIVVAVANKLKMNTVNSRPTTKRRNQRSAVNKSIVEIKWNHEKKIQKKAREEEKGTGNRWDK